MQRRLFTCAVLSSLLGLVFALRVGAEPLLEGRVRLDSGEPVAEAQVRFFDRTDLERGAIARVQTDGTGYFALPLAALGRARPAAFALGPNYPNPFNPSTIIPYQLPSSSQVRLEVFNLLGQHLATLVDGERSAGFHTATWHATDGAGRAVGAGVYIYRMTVGAESQTGRMVLVDGQAGVSTAGAASVWSGASDGERAQVYGLIVSGAGLVPYVDSAFRVEAGMASVELVVSSGPYSAGKATDDDCALCDLFGGFNEAEEEEAETDSTASEGGPDLIVQPPSASATVLTPGQAFTLQVTVQNQGDEQAAATILHYYRSNNTTITASDTQVGTGAVDALDASATNAQSIELTASTGVERYYGACVDSVRGEINTDNNCSAAVKITVSEEETPEAEEDTPDEEADETPENEADETPEEGPDTPEDVPDDAPVTIPDAKLREAVAAALGKASGALITVAEMKTLTILLAFDAGISDLTGLEFATNLTTLGLFDNRITDLSALSGLTSLTDLGLHGNRITDLSALSGLTSLTDLGLSGNRITDLSALSGLTNLGGLSIYGNRITDLSALSGLTSLTLLHLSGNRITDLSALRGLTNLTSLGLEGNNISDISPLLGLTQLSWLMLANNRITDLSALRGLTNLTSLGLEGNNISDISPLLGLTQLSWLILANNRITDVSPLSGLTQLQELELANNRITDISPLLGLTQLSWLELLINPLSASSINDHIPALERRGATVYFDRPFRESDFDIELVFAADHFDEKDKREIRYAAQRWMSIIREDLPDYTFAGGWSSPCGFQSSAIPAGERIDDLRIYVRVADLPDAVAAWAWRDVLREDHRPVVGCVEYQSKGGRWDLALHEIGHVLGIGYWDASRFLQTSSDDPHFTGPRAIAAFDDAGGRSYTGAKVPVEKDGAHWRSSVFQGELMDWTYGPNRLGPLSAITIQALADLGWVVDVTQADSYTLPSAAAAKVARPFPGDRLMGRLAPQPEWSCGVGPERQPIHVVDEQGRIIRTLPR